MIRLPAFGLRLSLHGPRPRLWFFGRRTPEAARPRNPLGLRPKSVTPVCTSTSGAGNSDAIIASPNTFFVYWSGFSAQKIQTERAEAWESCLPGEHCNKRGSSREEYRMRRLMRPALLLLLVALTTLPAIAD